MSPFLLQHTTLVILGVALAGGISAALVAWLVSQRLAAVPREDREYKDPPPLGFRLAWMPIHWLSYFMQPLLSDKKHGAVMVQLRKAGLDYTVSPAQYIAARLVCAVLVAMLVCWGMSVFEPKPDAGPGFGLKLYLELAAAGAVFGYAYPAIWLRDLLARRRTELLKSLPFYLDIITLCVEAGLNMQGAMNQAVAKGPKGVLRDDIQRVLRDIRAGKGRAESLRGMAERLNEPNVSSFVTAVIQAESMGMNLGPVLRAQADQRRTERFLRAEKLAMEAPVKMLFPLIAFIFPCTFVVLFFPIAMKFMHPTL
jgi:tight adherence protein C